MQLVLTSADQRKLDQLAIDQFGMPPFTLMENAGRAAAAAIEERFGQIDGRRVTIFCGKGNNGGDGLVVARVLFARGAHVNVLMLGIPSSPESRLNYSLLDKLLAADTTGRLNVATWDPTTLSLPRADLYVDAMLGTGLASPVRGQVAHVVDQLNDAGKPIVSLDVPTGLSADSGMPLGRAVEASFTVTMGALKPGLLMNEGPQYAHQIRLADIGIPEHLAYTDEIRRRYWLTTDHGIAQLLPKRSALAHKYSAGMVLVVGGATGLTGAPVMAATAAARVGAGYVACATPDSIQPIIASKLTEIATISLPEHPDGSLDATGALGALQPWLDRAGCVLIGPGLGVHSNTQAFVRQLLQSVDLPVVIDADGLRALQADQLNSHDEKRWILTPHWGEFSSMVSDTIRREDALELAHKWSRQWYSTLILKGLPSTVASPGHDGFICGTGSKALATAGTGDILAGLCAGLVAQGCKPLEAATCALHIGGAAADKYASQHPQTTMMALDMLEHLPAVLSQLLAIRT